MPDLVDILDDQEAIAAVDTRGMFATLEKLPHQVVESSEQALRLPMDPFPVDNVIVCGMGGSAIGGDLMLDWVGDRMSVPMMVRRGYHLPGHVRDNSLVFCVSYSGNTEETLSCFREATERNCSIVVITGGGELGRLAAQEDVPTYVIPTIKDMPPRLATAYLLFPMAMISHRLDIVDINGEMEEAVSLLKQLVDKTTPKTPLADNSAKIYAKALFGSTPVIYAPSDMGSLARRWQTQLNENSKIIARWDVIPEMNHNDIEGIGGDDRSKSFSAVLLRDSSEHSQVTTRFEYTKQLLGEKMDSVIEVWPRGESKLARMLQHLYMGDCTSLYLAVLRGVDPFDIPSIAGLKEHLSK